MNAQRVWALAYAGAAVNHALHAGAIADKAVEEYEKRFAPPVVERRAFTYTLSFVAEIQEWLKANNNDVVAVFEILWDAKKIHVDEAAMVLRLIERTSRLLSHSPRP